MGRLNVDQSVEDPVKTQAIAIANRLISLSESSSSFGYLGLCDSTSDDGYTFGGQSRRITSLNSAKASLHVAGAVAQGLGSKAAEEKIITDLDTLELLEKSLVARLFQTVTPVLEEEKAAIDSKTLHTEVLAALKRKEPTDLETVSIAITLGRYKDPKLLKTVQNAPSEAKAKFVSDGYYVNDFPVPVCRNRNVHFVPVADRVQIVEPTNFIVAAPGAIPNAVLLEVKYKPKGNSQTTSVQMGRRVCALLGGSAPATLPSCFMFRFPQGLTEDFKTPADFLNRALWVNNGTWQQASGGTVPGAGKLRLTIDPVLPAMPPDQSLAIGLYHWIRHMRPAPDPEAVITVMHQAFQSRGIFDKSTETSVAPVNSCLVSDTGAREHGFSKNTEKGSEGQLAIEQCFEYAGQLDQYPQSAMPLFVNKSGNVNLAGRNGFDPTLVSKYWSATYATNLAAIETAATAKLVSRQAALENRELQLKLSIIKQELSSSSKRLNSLLFQKHGIKNDTALKALESSIEKAAKNIAEYKSAIATIETRQVQLRYVNELSRSTLRNAERASAKTYEICSTTFTLLRNGLHALDAPSNGFLLGRKHLFIPIRTPVHESDFFEAAAWSGDKPEAQQERLANISPWFQNVLPVMVPADEMIAAGAQFTIDNKPANQVLSEVEVTDDMPPLTILIDSRELRSPDNAVLHSSSVYPFPGTPVSEDQAFFYAKSATTTGDNKDVVWSVVMRDLVLHENTAPGKVLTGTPSTSWEKKFSPPLQSNCGLAVEFQLRRPLPHIEGIPEGAYIMDPKKRMMTPQIPPIPVELM